MNSIAAPKIGVIIVSFNSADVIMDCLKSLLASDYSDLSIVVCDNASVDNSCDLVRQCAHSNDLGFGELNATEMPENANPKPMTLIHSGANLGYAGGVNLGLEFLMNSPDIDHFWILNPDSEVAPDAASEYAKTITSSGDFSLMGGRTLYHGENGMIQSDGGRVNMQTGICSNVNVGLNIQSVTMPDARELDFISGANMIASRKFVETAGKMRDGYFLYYEEVDWALRRGNLPLVTCAKSIIYHHAGTAIGSGTTRRRPSAFANYFNYRNRVWFVRNFRPMAVPVAYVYSALKVGKLLLAGAWDEANGAWRGLNNFKPPKSVAGRIDASAHKLAFGKRPK